MATNGYLNYLKENFSDDIAQEIFDIITTHEKEDYYAYPETIPYHPPTPIY